MHLLLYQYQNGARDTEHRGAFTELPPENHHACDVDVLIFTTS
jgi:hypothetical protein